MGRYRSFDTEAPDYEPMQFWSSEGEGGEADAAAWLASLGSEGATADPYAEAAQSNVTDMGQYRGEDSA
jgi:hypothetical protein